MRILFTSDLHGLDSAYETFSSLLSNPKYSVGVLAGDLMTYPSPKELKIAKSEIDAEKDKAATKGFVALEEVVARAIRIKENHYKEVLRRSRKPIVFVMGNDDGILGSGLEWSTERYAICINNRKVMYGKYGLVGHQYTNPFVGGSFEKSENDQTKDMEQIEKLIDPNTIFVTHGPAKWVLDTALDGKHVGSMALAKMLKRKPVWLHLFGHIHGTFGSFGNAVNGAYPLKRKFLEIEVETRTIKIV